MQERLDLVGDQRSKVHHTGSKSGGALSLWVRIPMSSSVVISFEPLRYFLTVFGAEGPHEETFVCRSRVVWDFFFG